MTELNESEMALQQSQNNLSREPVSNQNTSFSGDTGSRSNLNTERNGKVDNICRPRTEYTTVDLLNVGSIASIDQKLQVRSRDLSRSVSGSSRCEWKEQMRKKHLPSIFVNEAFDSSDCKVQNVERIEHKSPPKRDIDTSSLHSMYYYMSSDYHPDFLMSDSLPRPVQIHNYDIMQTSRESWPRHGEQELSDAQRSSLQNNSIPVSGVNEPDTIISHIRKKVPKMGTKCPDSGSSSSVYSLSHSRNTSEGSHIVHRHTRSVSDFAPLDSSQFRLITYQKSRGISLEENVLSTHSRSLNDINTGDSHMCENKGMILNIPSDRKHLYVQRSGSDNSRHYRTPRQESDRSESDGTGGHYNDSDIENVLDGNFVVHYEALETSLSISDNETNCSTLQKYAVENSTAFERKRFSVHGRHLDMSSILLKGDDGDADICNGVDDGAECKGQGHPGCNVISHTRDGVEKHSTSNSFSTETPSKTNGSPVIDDSCSAHYGVYPVTNTFRQCDEDEPHMSSDVNAQKEYQMSITGDEAINIDISDVELELYPTYNNDQNNSSTVAPNVDYFQYDEELCSELKTTESNNMTTSDNILDIINARDEDSLKSTAIAYSVDNNQLDNSVEYSNPFGESVQQQISLENSFHPPLSEKASNTTNVSVSPRFEDDIDRGFEDALNASYNSRESLCSATGGNMDSMSDDALDDSDPFAPSDPSSSEEFKTEAIIYNSFSDSIEASTCEESFEDKPHINDELTLQCSDSGFPESFDSKTTLSSSPWPDYLEPISAPDTSTTNAFDDDFQYDQPINTPETNGYNVIDNKTSCSVSALEIAENIKPVYF